MIMQRADSADSTDSPDDDSMPFMRDIISARAAAAALNVHERTIRRAISRGELPASKFAGTFRIQRTDLEAYRRTLAPSVSQSSQAAAGRQARPRRSGATSHRLVSPGSLALPPLPRTFTSFVGRTDLVRSVADVLATPENRLVTLTGPGGVGKTRLSLVLANDLRTMFADGVGFVSLSAVREPDLVLATISQYLGLPEGDRRSLLRRIQSHLAGWRCLLVLDNFEHLVAAASVVTELLDICPGLRFIATSRSPLRVSAERVIPVPPLMVAAADAGAGRDISEAEQLFVDRAVALRPSFALTDANRAAVSAICARLDGLPLAIELAAARSDILPPPIMLARLDQRLPLLHGGVRDLPDRHQTMRSTIAWSYELLGPGEQSLFRHLAVFVGGFSLEALVAVAGNEIDGEPDPFDAVLSRLAVLADHSLVRLIDVPDQARYEMLGTIREFGLEQLRAHAELDAARWRHARHFLAIIQEIDPDLNDPGQALWFDRLDRDRPNLQAAVTWFLDHGDAAAAQRLAAAPWQYWEMRGFLTEGRDWLERALALAGDVDPAIRAAAFWRLGYFCYDLGESLEAQTALESSLALYESADDGWGRATALNALGLVAGDQGDLTQAQRHHERALEFRRELRDETGIAISLGNLGNVAGALGDYDRARALHSESLSLRIALDRPRGIAYQSLNVGHLALSERRLSDAGAMLERGLAIFEGLGDQVGIAFAVYMLGSTAAESGNLGAAAAFFTRTLALHQRLNLQRGLVVCIRDVAYASRTVDPARAARLLGAVERLETAAGTVRTASMQPPWDRAIASLERALGGPGFADAWQAGQRLTLTSAIGEAETVLTAISASHPATANPAQAPDRVAWDKSGLSPARAKCCVSWPPASQISPSPRHCSSVRQRSSGTSLTSWRSSTCPRAPPPLVTPSARDSSIRIRC